MLAKNCVTLEVGGMWVKIAIFLLLGGYHRKLEDVENNHDRLERLGL